MRALLNIDRRWVFLLVFIVVTLAHIWSFRVPIEASGTVCDVYNAVETLHSKIPGRERAVLVVSLDFDPSSAPELTPMARAILRHAFQKNHRVIGLTHWPAGLALADQIMNETVEEFDDVLVSYGLYETEREAAERVGVLKSRVEGVAKLHAACEQLVLSGTLETAQERHVRRAAERLGLARWVSKYGILKTRFEMNQERLHLLDRDGRAEVLLGLAAEVGDAAVVVPGQKLVVRDRRGQLAWDPGLHGVLAHARPGSVTKVRLANGAWIVLEVLLRSPALKRGVDFCYLGQKPGAEILIVSMGQSLYGSFPTDTAGTSTREMPMLADVPSLREIDYLITLAAGDTGEKWISYGHEKSGFPMSVGCTAVMAPDLYPYRQAKQIDGIIGGIRGAWEYEALTGIAGRANDAVAPQTAAHFLVILLILVCNIGYFFSRRQRAEG